MTDDIYQLGSDMVDELVQHLPMLATYLGVPGHEHEMNDFSPAGYESTADLIRSQLRRVEATPVPDEPWGRLAHRVAVQFAADELAWHDADEHLLELNSIASPIQDIREVFDHMDTSTADGWTNVASRLEGLGDALDGYRQTLELGRSRGMTVARRQVIEAARQARNYAADGSFFDTLPGAAAEVADEGLLARLGDGVATAKQAYGAIAGYLESTYLPDAIDADGVGEERYVRLARKFLGADIEPRATYDWGWEEVARIRAAMSEVANEILPEAELREVLHLLQTDPGRATQSQQEFRDLMQERLEVALSDLEGAHFEVPEPIRRVDVKMAPPGGSLGAYYVSPSEDFTRPGTVWWSIGETQVVPLFDQVSTAYHEGFPGHHLQSGLQMTAGDRVSRLQKLLVWYSGSGEGWALYAEDLMDELGYLEKPDYRMGKLSSEMLRACRVVIDIGSHLDLPVPEGQPFHPGERWSFDLGVEMLEEYAAQEHDVAVSEMNRYLGWAGQAISYKVGQQAIHDLRSDARRRRGSAFDQKDFHARLLAIGSTGLTVMRDHMAEEST
ncbi:MAG TPA: DUF885 domain-containing protein [Acidimicrobiia bacterium]|nr:DUF885 domain-containing protein [Acidimicrobiia bacterium]